MANPTPINATKARAEEAELNNAAASTGRIMDINAICIHSLYCHEQYTNALDVIERLAEAALTAKNLIYLMPKLKGERDRIWASGVYTLLNEALALFQRGDAPKEDG